jgi:hypothetical protein
MGQGDEMSEPDRMAVAKVSGAAERLTIGVDKDVPLAVALAELHEISTDPAVFGEVLGAILYRVETEHPYFGTVAELLRAAGADEDVAAARLATLRERAAGRDGGFRL